MGRKESDIDVLSQDKCEDCNTPVVMDYTGTVGENLKESCFSCDCGMCSKCMTVDDGETYCRDCAKELDDCYDDIEEHGSHERL